ncbi:MAG: hypothetical protein HYX66_05665 [Ignavibacteria bacterium]|nr:hypothetical protein [Ignavibacteria bacterium]
MAKGKKIIRSWGDYLLVLFILLVLSNSVVAYLNNVKLINWASEYSLFLLILYYFPIREIFGNDEKSFKQLLVIFSVLSLMFLAVSFQDYLNRLHEGSMYAYQIQSSRSVLFGPFFALVIIYAVPAFFHINGFWSKLSLFLLTLVCSLGLLQTFTRSLWVAALISVLITMFFFTFRQNISIVFVIVMMVLIVFTGAMIYNPRLTNIAVKLIANRFLASAEVKGGDLSMDYRIAEAEGAFKQLRGNYLSGNGLRSEFVRWNMIEQQHDKGGFVHFGGVSQIYKLGVPLTILLFAIMANALTKIVSSIRRRNLFGRTSLYRAVAIGSLGVVPTFLSMFFMTGLMERRYGNVLVGFLLALVSIVHNKSQELGDSQ